MKLKKILFIAMIFAIVFSIATVSATESTVSMEDNSLNDLSTYNNILTQSNSKEPVNLVCDDITMYYKNGTRLVAHLYDSNNNPLANKTIDITLNDIKYQKITDKNGEVSMGLNLINGNYDTSISFSGDFTYSPALKNIKINILSVESGSDLTKGFRDTEPYYATFLDGQGNPLVNREVSFNIHGVFYKKTTDENGVAKLNINLNPGTYTLTAIHPDNGFMHSNTVKVLRGLNTYETIDETVFTAGVGGNVVLKLYNSLDHTISDKSVGVTINNRYYTYTTDSEGKVTIPVDFKKGTYNVKINFYGDYYYYSSSNNFKIEFVDPLNTEFNVMSEKTLFNGEEFKVEAIDQNNNLIKNTAFVFEVNGTSFKTTTDNNGIAKLKINLTSGYHTVEYYIDDKHYSDKSDSTDILTFSTKNTQIVSDMIKVPKGTKFTVLLTDDGLPLSNKTVIFTIQNVKYEKITDENGYASISINLNPGTYEIKYAFNGDSKFSKSSNSTRIQVTETQKTNLKTVGDTEFNYGEDNYYQVKLTDAKGKPLADKEIVFTVNSNQTTVKTDSSGIAYLKLNLKPGNYTISYAYAGDMDYAASEGSNAIKIISSNSTITSVSLDEIIDAAVKVKEYYSTSGELPSEVIIGNRVYTLSEALYLFNQAIVNINKNITKDIDLLNNTSGPESNVNTQNNGELSKSEYLDVYSRVANYIINHKQAPNYASSNLGFIGFKELIESSSRVLAFYKENKQLPNTVKIVKESSGNYSTNLTKLALQLIKGKTTDKDKAIALYNYVRDEISYSFYYNTQKGAQGTLDAGTGNCCDQAQLLVAMYRVANITCRFAHGTCAFTDGVYGHVWPQVLLDGTWVNTDPTSTRNSFGVVNNWNTKSYTLHGYYDVLPF